MSSSGKSTMKYMVLLQGSVRREPDCTPLTTAFLLRLQGAYAEYIKVPQTHIIRKPAHLSWIDAASIPENWITGVLRSCHQ